MVTEWGEWDACSATCGLGMKRRERMVKMPPSDGSICGAEVVEVEKCMMPECREYKSTHVNPCKPRYSYAFMHTFLYCDIYTHVYAVGRCFYPKQFTLHYIIHFVPKYVLSLVLNP